MSHHTSKPRSQPAPGEQQVHRSQSTDEHAARTLTLVPAPAAERLPLLAERAATELRELIRSLQEPHAARRSQPGGAAKPDDEPFPAA